MSSVSVYPVSLHIHQTFLPSFKWTCYMTRYLESESFSRVKSAAHCSAHNTHHLITVPLWTQTAWNNSLFTAAIPIVLQGTQEEPCIKLCCSFSGSSKDLDLNSESFFLLSATIFKAAGVFFGHTLAVNESSTWVEGWKRPQPEVGRYVSKHVWICEKTHAAISTPRNQKHQAELRPNLSSIRDRKLLEYSCA